MLCEQVTCRGGEIGFDYPAKSGRQYCREFVDEEAFATVRALLRRRDGGERLLMYWESCARH
ncbi:hypothetical protein ABZV67_21715 [Streptomyces sp. NPDC005065]|uniref:hypothetical protein n=1 Tax=Streptomyces sp. NPDC005065 TaxID=3154461 RepID=UPI0033BE8662